jgi:protein-tyrosine phosphatase
MTIRTHLAATAIATLLSAGTGWAGTLSSAEVVRAAPDQLKVTWADSNPVDVYVSSRPDATVKTAKLISAADADGQHAVTETDPARSYFLLRDRRSGEVVRVAERLLPLEHGSNFRDIGGYQTTGGKRVRWGMIYRSGAMPLLSPDDVTRLRALGLVNSLDLRSDEERVLAPSRLGGVPYSAVGYSMSSITSNLGSASAPSGMEAVYRNFPSLLAPQMRLLVRDLAEGGQPIVYNCSAGQDRTGFATAMILSVLGVPRETILADYHLSTAYRHPENEMPKIDKVAQANNPIAMFFAGAMQDPRNSAPKPLKTADGTAFLAYAFDEVEKRWGSPEDYLRQMAGMSTADLAKLRATYLE